MNLAKTDNNQSKHISERMFVIIPAAGVGLRMQSDVAKQFLTVCGKSILEHTLIKFATWQNQFAEKQLKKNIYVIIALAENATLPFAVTAYQQDAFTVTTCIGGATRAASVTNALDCISKLANENSWIMVHDAARPLVNIADIENLYQTVISNKIGGLLAKKITSTIKQANINSTTPLLIDKTLCRNWLYEALTPQMFQYQALKTALENAINNSDTKITITDEASAMELSGHQVQLIETNNINIKITTKQDLHLLNYLLTGE